MTLGSPEWMAAKCKEIVEGAKEQLDSICIVAASHSHISSVKMQQPDMVKVAMYGNEVQSRSFSLGVKMGMQLILEELGNEHRNAGQG